MQRWQGMHAGVENYIDIYYEMNTVKRRNQTETSCGKHGVCCRIGLLNSSKQLSLSQQKQSTEAFKKISVDGEDCDGVSQHVLTYEQYVSLQYCSRKLLLMLVGVVFVDHTHLCLVFGCFWPRSTCTHTPGHGPLKA